MGLAVIIDVFRAFSVACYCMGNGAEKIIPVADIGFAYKLKEKKPDYLLIGERQGKKQPGFDFGNSPASLENEDFTGKTVVQTTSAGTQGIVKAVNADQIIAASLVNAPAVVKYIRAEKPAVVSLVCMGNAGISTAEEDLLCAEYIKNSLENLPYNLQDGINRLKHSNGRRFFDPANSGWAPERDFYLCTDLGRFDFVLRAEKKPGLLHLIKVSL